MADFKTHLSGGIVTGLGVSAVSFFTTELDIVQVFSVFVMGTVGGMLPDIDSDSGKPLSFLFGILSVLLPALLLTKINRQDGLSPEFLLSYFVIAYFIINNVICEIIKKLTVHRGIMHSIPFAVLSGEISYLLFISSGRTIAMIMGLAVFIGCIVHLILDELNSFTFKFGIIPILKKSSGSALKLKSDNNLISIFMYLLIIGITAVILLR